MQNYFDFYILFNKLFCNNTYYIDFMHTHLCSCANNFYKVGNTTAAIYFLLLNV